ncbi:MAG: hypothetical protein EA350_14365 [Gemmatimonadales bacterium]|nr:MAG: hypothetical protein EA350_14365 [Gemmatimonadales bacterium]
MDAAVAALDHVRHLFPFTEVTLATTQDAKGVRNTSLIEAIGATTGMTVDSPSSPAVVCEERCRMTERRSFVQIGVRGATEGAATVSVSWLAPVERDGTLVVRSGYRTDIDLTLRNGSWEVVRMAELDHFTITGGGS